MARFMGFNDPMSTGGFVGQKIPAKRKRTAPVPDMPVNRATTPPLRGAARAARRPGFANDIVASRLPTPPATTLAGRAPITPLAAAAGGAIGGRAAIVPPTAAPGQILGGRPAPTPSELAEYYRQFGTQR